MRPSIFITRPLPEEALSPLASRCDLRVHREDGSIRQPEMIEACRDVEGVMVCGARLPREVLEQARRLRAVSNVGVGYDNIDVGACTARRIPVTNTAGTLEDTTAELAFALLISVARRVVEGDRHIRHGQWKQWQFSLLWGTDLHQRTLGIYGFGRIGQKLARLAHGFSMRILYHSRHRAAASVERELNATYVDSETLLRESDFLSLNVPLTPETHHLIQADELNLMKPTAFLINTARGKVVDEEALVRALQTGKIAGAGLDVFEHEPQISQPLLAMPNVVLLPHIGSATTRTRFNMAQRAAENMLDLLEGRRPANVVNPEVYA